MRAILWVVIALAANTSALAQSERVVEIPSRGQNVRALLIMPDNPVGSVILLAGGHGKLDLAPNGAIGWGRGNQLVRTRAAYAAAGFITMVPDIAPDLKTSMGVVQGYRYGDPHARDIGAIVAYLRRMKAPVVLAGTSRGSVSASNAAARLSGAQRPDALALTAPMLVTVPGAPSVQSAAGNDPGRLKLPMLVVGHRKDTCRYTLPASITTFKIWYAADGGTFDTVLLDGPEGSGDPCEARAAHGFAGIDGQVVAAVTGWIRKQNLR